MDCYTLYRTKTTCPMCRAEVGDLYTEEVLPSAPMADATNRQNVQPPAVFVDTPVIDAAEATAANPRIPAPQSRSQIFIHRILCSATLIFVLLVLMIILRAVTDKHNTD